MLSNFYIQDADVQRIMYKLINVLPARYNQGLLPSRELLEHVQNNYRLTYFQALRLIVQLKRLNIIHGQKVHYTNNRKSRHYLFVNQDALFELYQVHILELIDYEPNFQLLSGSMVDTLVETLNPTTMYKYINVLRTNKNFQCHSGMNRHFTIRKNGTITYTPANKPTLVNADSGKWSPDKYRVTIKPGRALYQIFNTMGYSIPNADIEQMTNALKSRLTFNAEFHIVSGEEIREYYHYSNYANTNIGTLADSCMRYDSCQKFLDIYTCNPDKVKMLIAKVPNDNTIIGRALLWLTDTKQLIMDRIYGTEITINAFKEYARQHGYWHKDHQNYSSTTFVTTTGELITSEQTVTLLGNHEFYPYLDTFKHADNIISEYITLSTQNGDYTLTSTDGYNDDDMVVTECGTRMHRDDAYYCERYGNYYTPSNATWSNFEDDAIPNNMVLRTYCNEYVWTDSNDIYFAEDTQEYHFYDDVQYSETDKVWLYDRTFLCPVAGLCDHNNTIVFMLQERTIRCHTTVTLDDLLRANELTQDEYDWYHSS